MQAAFDFAGDGHGMRLVDHAVGLAVHVGLDCVRGAAVAQHDGGVVFEHFNQFELLPVVQSAGADPVPQRVEQCRRYVAMHGVGLCLAVCEIIYRMAMKWEILDHRILYRRYFRLDEYRLRHERYDGGSNEVVREIFERGNAVVVLPYDPVRDEVVLIEQFRPGAIHLEDGPWLLELIAGVIEEGEDPEAVARREAEEEAGCTLGALQHTHRYLVSPGGTTERVDIYAAEVSTEGLGGVHGLDEEHEDIRVHVVKRDEARNLLERGRIQNAAALIGLQWLALHGEALREQWLNRKTG